MEQGDRLAVQMQARADEAAEQVGSTQKEISGNKSFVALLQTALGDEPMPMKAGKNGLIPALAKDDDGLLALKKHSTKRVRDLIAARLAIKSWPLHIKRVGRIMAQAEAAGGLLPVPLKYCGAHTGRFSGGERINLQNLGKRSTEPLVCEVRQMLVAPPGHVLVCADAAQIEARVLAKLAGQDDLVQAFANHAPIYRQFAAQVLGRAVPAVQPNDPASIAKYLKKNRQLGKVGILGCGYGMGAARCQEMAKKQYQLDISFETALRIVDQYRATNKKIVAFWYAIEKTFKYVVKYPGEIAELHGLQFSNIGDCVRITLPCGRILRYAGARVAFDGHYERIWWPYPGRSGMRVYAWAAY